MKPVDLEMLRRDVAEAERVVLACAAQFADELGTLDEHIGQPDEPRFRLRMASVQQQLAAAVDTLRRRRRKLTDARAASAYMADRRPLLSAGVVAHRRLVLLAATDAQLAEALSHGPFCDCAACLYALPIVERFVLDAENAIAEGTLP